MNRGLDHLTHFGGKTYMWIRNENGQLQTVPLAKALAAITDVLAEAKGSDDV